MSDIATLVTPFLGIGALVAGGALLWRLAAGHGDLREALRTRPGSVKIAYALVLLGVAAIVGWWTLTLEPPEFPWQAVVIVVGLASLIALVLRSRTARQ